MKKTLKIILWITLPVILLGAGAYFVFWKQLETHINQQIDTLWADAQASGVVITGEKPQMSGFPGLPTIKFQGTITDATGLMMMCPEITYTGFPVPGSRMKLDLPAGMTITGYGLPEPVTITEAHVYIMLPYNLPLGVEAKHMQAWQASGGAIPIESLHLKTDILTVDGQGTIGLDEKLQLAGTITTKIIGMDALLADLAERKVIQGKSAVMAQSMIQMLIQNDPVTGEPFFQTALRIQNRGVFLGPLRVASLPELLWNTDSQPVRRQLPVSE